MSGNLSLDLDLSLWSSQSFHHSIQVQQNHNKMKFNEPHCGQKVVKHQPTDHSITTVQHTSTSSFHHLPLFDMDNLCNSQTRTQQAGVFIFVSGYCSVIGFVCWAILVAIISHYQSDGSVRWALQFCFAIVGLLSAFMKSVNKMCCWCWYTVHALIYSAYVRGNYNAEKLLF